MAGVVSDLPVSSGCLSGDMLFSYSVLPAFAVTTLTESY